MKKIAVYLALVLPALGLGLFAALPQLDSAFAEPLFHFYIVTFTTFAATVVSLFITISVGQTALPRHLLLALAFAWMGAVFFTHGLTTPGAVISHRHPALQWGAWLTLLGGGSLFLAGALAPNAPNPRYLRALAGTILVAYLVYAGLAAFAPDVLTALLSLRNPPLEAFVFALTLAIWLASGAKHYLSYRQTHNSIDGLMAFESVWYATATISMFRFPVWNASWWLYHLLLLVGFLVAVYALWRAYEQIRAFRLSRYFAAASLIVTAALALLSAQLYSALVYRNLLTQLETDSQALGSSLATEIAKALPQVTSADDLRHLGEVDGLRALVGSRLAGLHIDAVNLYDADGVVVFSTEAEWTGVRLDPDDHEDLEEVLAGETTYELHEPGSPPVSYQPAADIHILETYLPFRPAAGDGQAAAIGMLTTLREAPELNAALILSRRSGIGLAALSLGGLFLALLAIVRRADQIITSRTEELVRAYADVRKAEGIRDDLTKMIVHDLRNPLTAIAANLDLLGATLNDPVHSEASPRFLASARAAGQRMIGMIDDLLNVSKFEAGELRPVLRPVQLRALLAEKEESYRFQAQKEQKSVSLGAPANLPAVMADAGLIGRVLDNLIGNAFKYTSPGGRIELGAERRGDHVLVRVRDDGQGIPPEYHERIFEKFVQVTDTAGAPLRKGTGLGLAFCRLAVEAHQGRIWVQSVLGQGSTFLFTLPLDHN